MADFESYNWDDMAYKSYVDEMESQTHIDAEWKRIQEKTFTRWCNEQLKEANITLTDLSADLCNGVNLIILLEFLSQKKLGRYNKKPRIHAQKMENVEKSLNFITKEEGIRLVNIGSGDIVGGNLKLILGLIWKLILHYQIKLGLGLGESSKSKGTKELSAKNALLAYIQEKIPHKDIKNFTSSWNDGTAVAALVDAVAPGLCPEAELMSPKDALANAQHAMKLAEDWLQVPMVLTPEDMVNPNVDELSMMTYLSQYPEAELLPGAPIKPRGNPNKVKVSGPGVEGEGLKTGLPAVFYVDTKEAGVGKLEAIVEGADGPVEVRKEDNKDGSYKCSYVPLNEGVYDVDVKWNNQPIRETPFRVTVLPGTNALACRAYGPGVEGTDLKEGHLAEFHVETAGAGEGDLNIAIRGPKGPLDAIDVQQDPKEQTLFHVNYIPPTPSQYVVEVTFASLQIKDSPFKVRVIADKPDASKCHAQGPGVESNELEVDQETWFTVHTKGAGRGELVANTRGPHGEVPMTFTELEPGITKYVYTPKESGELVITIKYGGAQIPGSRFRVEVKPPPRPDKCIASGPGLAPHGIRVKEMTNFNVKTKDAGRGEVDVKIAGPGGAVDYGTQCWLNSYDYTYRATEPGLYTIDVKFAEQHVPGSPFQVAITDASKVTISGPGTKGEPVLLNEPLTFNVNAEGAGPGKVACHVTETPNIVEPTITDLDESNFEISYTPSQVGLQKMNVTFNEEPIPNTPLYLVIYDPSKVVAKGPGLEPGNKSGEMTYFTVDMRQAGEGHLHSEIKGPADTKLIVKDQANSVVRCEYMPAIEGEYVISLYYEEHHIPGSPFDVYIKQKANPMLVTAFGPGLESSGLTTDMLAEFTVDYSAAGESELQVKIEGPGGGVDFREEPLEAGIVKYSYYTDPEETGLYVVNIKFADEPIPNSPYKVPVTWKSDSTRVVAEGTGLEGGTSKEWAEFTIDLRKAGSGKLHVNIEGPSKPESSCSTLDEGIEKFRYFPELPGTYDISITFNGSHVPGSPFQPTFELATDSSQCVAVGPGLREQGVVVGDPGDFVIDTTKAGKGAVQVVVNGPQGLNQRNVAPVKPIITSNNDGTYNVEYNPRRVGTYGINVLFADSLIPGSPFTVNVTDPTKVILSGPGCSDKEDNEIPVGSHLTWTADTSEAGPGVITAKMSHLDETDEVEVVPSGTEDGIYRLKHQAKAPGSSELFVYYSGNQIDTSPSLAVFDATKVLVYGPAFDGIKVGEESLFTIDYSKAGHGKLSLNVVGPNQGKLKTLDSEEVGLTNFSFAASVAGVYELQVSFGHIAVPGSPFKIPVRDISRVIVGGSGVTGEGARINQPAMVVVDMTRSGPAELEAAVTTPSGSREVLPLSKRSEKDVYIYEVFQGSYTPTEPGYYGVEVAYNKESLPGSPYQVPIGAPELVNVEGSDVLCAFVGLDNVIECNTSEAGPGSITAEFSGPSPVERVSYSEPTDGGLQTVNYIVDQPGIYQAQVFYNEFPLEGGLKTIQAVDLAKVLASGPGLESGVCAGEPTHFNVDTTEAGEGTLSINIESPVNEDVPVNITKADESTYKVEYQPEEVGSYNVSISYNDREVNFSPVCVQVADPSKVKCTGAGLSHSIVNEPAEFTIDCTEAGTGVVNVKINGVDDIDIHDNCDGTHTVTYVASTPGAYDIDVDFLGVTIEESPFKMTCQRAPPDASKCIISGFDTPGSFTVDCKQAGGSGSLEVGVSGAYVPAEFVSVRHNGDYTFSVSYDISSPDETIISVKWHDQHLTGSPFVVPSIN